MPDYTTLGIGYPIPGDNIKAANVAAKLADDMKALAVSANQAIIAEGARAEGAAKTSSDAKDAVQDAQLAGLTDATYGIDLGTQNLNDFKRSGVAYQPNNANATIARNYPVEGMGGSLFNLPFLPSASRPTQMFVLNHAAGSAIYVRSLGSTGWTPWKTYMTRDSSDNRYYQKSVLDAGRELTIENISGVLQPGNHYQANNANATAERGYPVPGMGGTLINFQLIPSIQRMTQLFILNHGVGTAMYVRSLTGTGWTAWSTYMTQSSSDNRYYPRSVLDPILAGLSGGGAGSGAIEHEYRLSALRARRGPVEVATPGVVVLAFDHGLTKYKSIVQPLLAARNLPVTLAVNSQLLTDPTNSGAGNADLAAWASGSLVEIANHGRTHTFPADLKNEIRGGREELEAIIGQPIDTYVQAGITGDTWGGKYEDVAGTARGQVSYEAHAILAGVMPSSDFLYPLDGEPNPGAKGVWLDNGGAAVTTARANITAAVTKRKMTMIRLHPEHIDGSGRITAAELTSFLDWLVVERTAGKLTVLQLRDASIATPAPIARDTGVKDITSLVAAGSISSGAITFQHKNGWNVITLADLKPATTGTVNLFPNSNPTLKPWAPGMDGVNAGGAHEAITLGSAGTDYRRLSINYLGGASIYGATTTDVLNGTMMWPMNRAMP